MDAFFASIEERDKPRLKGRPIVVGADPQEGSGRGVVSTANYAARKYGIRSAMPISRAWRLAEAAQRRGEPETVFMDGDFSRYHAVSREIFKIVERYSDHIEPASVDEVYFDMSHCENFEAAAAACERLKSDVKKEQRLTASVGIAPNKLVAKLASEMHKPDGLTVIPPAAVETALDPLPIRAISGIGPKTESQLAQRGVATVRDLKKFPKAELEEWLGMWGAEIYEKIRGQDASPIIEEYETKSIGEQETFSSDTLDAGFLTTRLRALCRGVYWRWQATEFAAFRTVVLTVRFADFTTLNRSRTLSKPGTEEKTIHFEALRLLAPFLDARSNPQHKAIRLLGVRIEQLIRKNDFAEQATLW